MADQRLLLVVNHRDTEPLGDVLLAGLAREPATRALEIGGLAAAGRRCAAWPRSSAGGCPARDVERVHARTGGNPFYVAEVGRVLVDRPDGLVEWPVPAGVREAIGTRLARLSPETVRLAAGRVRRRPRVPVTVVADMLEASGARPACRSLDEAVAAGLVAYSSPGDHRFVHDLVRDAVEAGLAAAERVRLHRSAADAVERLHAGRLEPHLSDLARHWAVGGRVAGSGSRQRDWIRGPRTRRCVVSPTRRPPGSTASRWPSAPATRRRPSLPAPAGRRAVR